MFFASLPPFCYCALCVLHNQTFIIIFFMDTFLAFLNPIPETFSFTVKFACTARLTFKSIAAIQLQLLAIFIFSITIWIEAAAITNSWEKICFYFVFVNNRIACLKFIFCDHKTFWLCFLLRSTCGFIVYRMIVFHLKAVLTKFGRQLQRQHAFYV